MCSWIPNGEEAKIAGNHPKLITHLQMIQVKPRTRGNDSLVHLKLQEKPPYFFFKENTLHPSPPSSWWCSQAARPSNTSPLASRCAYVQHRVEPGRSTGSKALRGLIGCIGRKITLKCPKDLGIFKKWVNLSLLKCIKGTDVYVKLQYQTVALRSSCDPRTLLLSLVFDGI